MHPLVHRWAQRHGLQPDDVEEANCRVLLRLYEYLPRFSYDPDRGRFRGYLKQTLRSVISEMFRESKKTHASEHEHGQFVLEIQSNPEARENLLAELIEEHRFHQWREAKRLARLRCEGQHVWQAWSMTREQQMSPKDAAKQLGIPLATFYVYIGRVTNYIREEFERLDG